MAQLKNCPRTGMIIRGRRAYTPNPFPVTQAKNRNLPLSAQDPVPLRSGHHSHVAHVVSTLPSPIVSNVAQMRELAQEIGKAIAEQLRQWPIEHKITLPEGLIATQSAGFVRQIAQTGQAPSIDESIADVGIGNTDTLAKGELSGNLATSSVKQESIGVSLNKLRKLKGK